MKLTPRHFIILTVVATVVILGGIFYIVRQNASKFEKNFDQYQEIQKIDQNTEIINQIPVEAVTTSSPIKELVKKVELKVNEVNDAIFSKPNVLYQVTFVSQAPLGVWDELHEETCEEASMVMIDKYFKKLPLNKDIMEQELQAQVAWQTEHGYDIDINARETQDILKTYYGLTNTALIINPKVEDLKKVLNEGKLIIVPLAGQMLGNPYYTPPGPEYHMLVVIGYDDDQKEFITNDPGTKRGGGYHYGYDVFMNAIHDWNNGDVLNGAKVILTVGGNK